MIDFVPSLTTKKPVNLSKKDWIDTDEPQVVLLQGMRKSGKGVGVDSIAETYRKEGITILHIWGARSFENLYWMINKNCGVHHEKLKIIVKGMLESYYSKIVLIDNIQGKKLEKPIHVKLGLREICMKYGLSDSEYDDYLELAVKRDLMINVSDNIFKLTKLGLQYANNELLHCKCSKAYPIILTVPHYIKFDQSTVDRFNLEHSPSWTDPIGIKRIVTPLLKIRHIIPPTKSDQKEKFVEEMTDIILQARKESRIVVMNPSFFVSGDKFDTLGAIVDMLPYLMNNSGHFTPLTEKKVGKSMKYWSKKQRSHHKIAVIINEIRSAVPGGGMYGDKGATKSKRSVKDKIPEMRHFKTWFVSDYQNPQDIDPTLRVQSNYIVVKRSARDILGDSWTWFFNRIATDRMNLVRKKLKGFEIKNTDDAEKLLRKKGSKFRNVKKWVDDRRPTIEDMDDNVGYVTAQGMSVKRHTFALPSFHHKTSLEDFKGDTGLEWTVELDDQIKKTIETSDMSKQDTKKNAKEKRSRKNEVCKKIHHLHTVEGKTFPEVHKELVRMEKEGIIQNMGFEKRDSVYVNNMWNRWKRANGIE